jgi:hypothetical protein
MKMAKAKDTEAGALYARLAAFTFDDPAADRPFTARLAEENGWTAEFTARAIEEYRRFIYLAVTSCHSVVPSEVVDKVWHLHLIYTRSYWDGLCRGVLGMPLHHHPSPGGPSANEEGRRNYRATLATYLREFGTPPPAIWPEPKADSAQSPHPGGSCWGPSRCCSGYSNCCCP